MARIIILDNNRSTGVLLKRALERENHQVGLVADWQGLSANMENPGIDLVLIHREDSEWTAFNKFKITHKNNPAMLYVMRDHRLSMVWIVKAVQEVLSQMNKLDDPTALWHWDTACNDCGVSYFVP